MIQILARIVLQAGLSWLGDILKSWYQAQMEQKLGSQATIIKGQEVVTEIADAQVKAATDRPSDDDLLDSLRNGRRL
jgi:hypothetical protein